MLKVPALPNANKDDAQKHRLIRQLPVQMKVLTFFSKCAKSLINKIKTQVYNVCYYWVEHYYADDFVNDGALAKRFQQFVVTLAKARGVQDRLTPLVERRRAQVCL